MKRLAGLSLIVAFMLALGISHLVLAKPPPGKQKKKSKVYVCHITDEGVNGNGLAVWQGHVIHISTKALPAHCAHGDHAIPNLNGGGPGDSCERFKLFTRFTCNGKFPVDPVLDDDD